MNGIRAACLFILLAGAAGFAACSHADDGVELYSFPADSREGVIALEGVRFDPDVSADGSGSIRIDAEGPVSIPLYVTGKLDVEDATLLYEAKVRTTGLTGRAYLEMWCVFSGRGEYFSRDLATPVPGGSDWSDEQAVFFLKQGENPDYVRLNIVIEGQGTVWVDDLRLAMVPGAGGAGPSGE